MKFIPILFSTPMVQAILEGRKIQTRRVIKQKDQPHLKYDNSCIDYSNGFGWVVKHQIEEDPDRYEITQNFKCPYGQVGDILWVRESFTKLASAIIYKADQSYELYLEAKWKPSIHMLKSACRIFLKIKSIRVERLQDISEEDAKAEGVKYVIDPYIGYCGLDYIHGGYNLMTTPYKGFRSLWKKINGEQSWDDNPWVWVIEFERIEKPENFK